MVILNSDQQLLMHELFAEMRPSLLSYAKRTLHDDDLAEEAVQEVFQVACLKVDRLFASENQNGWLVNTLKHVMRNMRKKQFRTENLFISDRDLDYNTAAIYGDISAETRIACEEILGVEDYLLLKRVALKEATIAEAALEAGISRDACSKRIQRSKKKLRRFFQK